MAQELRPLYSRLQQGRREPHTYQQKES